MFNVIKLYIQIVIHIWIYIYYDLVCVLKFNTVNFKFSVKMFFYLKCVYIFVYIFEIGKKYWFEFNKSFQTLIYNLKFERLIWFNAFEMIIEI